MRAQEHDVCVHGRSSFRRMLPCIFTEDAHACAYCLRAHTTHAHEIMRHSFVGVAHLYARHPPLRAMRASVRAGCACKQSMSMCFCDACKMR
mmetsp:Transcript_33343/g.64318  ORF Transcript_33343/g.64318 Transcript_33343/m.64318 type:complete len:92 (+) Transcript_33343:549-824(+)